MRTTGLLMVKNWLVYGYTLVCVILVPIIRIVKINRNLVISIQIYET